MSSLSSLFGAIKSLIILFVLWSAKQAGRKEVLQEKAEKDSKLNEEYLKINTDGRTVDDSLGRMQGGNFFVGVPPTCLLQRHVSD